MLEVIIEITSYLIVAILLGYTFGWIITKALCTQKLNRLNRIILKERENHELEMNAFIAEREEMIKEMKASKN